MTNQYAAMPSLHFGWSLWCGVVIVILAPKAWMKALGLLHPLFTVSAIIATANHWVLDAVGGATVVALGFGLTYALAGPRKLRLPTVPAAAKPLDDLVDGTDGANGANATDRARDTGGALDADGADGARRAAGPVGDAVGGKRE